MRRFFLLLGSFVLLATTASHSFAQYDLSDKWLVSGMRTFLGETEPYTNMHWQVVQSAGTLTLTVTNQDGVVVDTMSGTIDELTGAFHIDVPAPSEFHPEATGAIDGTVAADSRSFTASGTRYACAVIACMPISTTYDGTRCGNGESDAGETCDDGNANADDCCSPSCAFDAAGASCTSDDNGCTDDRCDGAGVCEHTNNATPCTDDTGCSSGTCAAGACVPATALPAGTSCNLDANLCTTDTCDGAGACTAGGPLDCAPCGECDAAYGCIAGGSYTTGCVTDPGIVTLKLNAGGGGKSRISLDVEEVNSVHVFQMSEFGNPTTVTDYTLCVYREDGLTPPTVLLRAIVPAGGMCGEEPCWSFRDGRSPRFLYKNNERTPDGIKSIRIQQSRGFSVKGGRQNLLVPAGLPPGPAALVPKLIANDGVTTNCWMHAVEPQKQTPTRFKGTYEPSIF